MIPSLFELFPHPNEKWTTHSQSLHSTNHSLFSIQIRFVSLSHSFLTSDGFRNFGHCSPSQFLSGDHPWNDTITNGIHKKLKIALASETNVQNVSIKAPQSILPLKTYNDISSLRPYDSPIWQISRHLIQYHIHRPIHQVMYIGDGKGGTISTVVLLPKLVLYYSEGHDLGFRVNFRSAMSLFGPSVIETGWSSKRRQEKIQH
jgi:hypothetical protein